jgi:uncharacterized membrane protein
MFACLLLTSSGKHQGLIIGGASLIALGAILVPVAVWRVRQLRRPSGEASATGSSQDVETRRKLAGFGLAIGWGIGGIVAGVLALLLARTI